MTERRVKRELCWGHDCWLLAAPDPDARWRGHYCQDCQHRLRLTRRSVKRRQQRE